MNINENVRVFLTDRGKKILREEVDESLFKKYEIGSNNFFQFQLWELMFYFGEYCSPGQEQIFKDNWVGLHY